MCIILMLSLSSRKVHELNFIALKLYLNSAQPQLEPSPSGNMQVSKFLIIAASLLANISACNTIASSSTFTAAGHYSYVFTPTCIVTVIPVEPFISITSKTTSPSTSLQQKQHVPTFTNEILPSSITMLYYPPYHIRLTTHKAPLSGPSFT